MGIATALTRLTTTRQNRSIPRHACHLEHHDCYARFTWCNHRGLYAAVRLRSSAKCRGQGRVLSKEREPVTGFEHHIAAWHQHLSIAGDGGDQRAVGKVGGPPAPPGRQGRNARLLRVRMLRWRRQEH